METKQKLQPLKRITVLVVIALVVALIVSGALSVSASKKETETLSQQRNQISNALGSSSPGIYDEISLVESVDPRGRPLYVGVMSLELEMMLEDLVDSYNSDPSTTKPVGLEEVRQSLTENIVEATHRENRESAFRHFHRWTQEPADLVYNGNVTNADGSINNEGDPVVDPPTNLDFSVKQNTLYSNYQFAWVQK